MTKQILTKGKEIYGKVRRHITPAFLIALALSLIFWYSGKLQYTYTAEVPVSIVIEGERLRTTCVVEGTGHNIVAARYFKRKTIKVGRLDVDLLPVDGASNTYEVMPESIKNIITVRNPSLKVISVSRLPFVVLDEER